MRKGDRNMMRGFSLTMIAIAALACGNSAHAQPQDEKGKVCRMEQQCHWENFKKICTWVKVCR
jgi:hypothetical protein